MILFAYTFISLLLILIVSKKNIKVPFDLIIIFAFILRIVITLLFLTSKSEDLNSFLIMGQNLLERSPKYESDYFPFISYLGLIAIYLRNYLHPFIFLKIIFALFDALILIPLYFLSNKNLQSAFIYALNPISIIVMNIHGQMESIPLFFFMTGLLFFLKGKNLYAVLTLSYGIYTKQWPLLFVIPLIKKSKKRFLFIGLALFPLLLTILHSLFFPNSIYAILERVKNYRGVFGAWGVSKLLLYITGNKLNPFIMQWMRRIFLISFFTFSLYWKDKNIIKNIIVLMLFLFAFTPTFGIQWLTWIVPFVIIVRPKLWKLFLVLGSFYLTFGFAWDAYQYFRDIMPLWNSVVNRIGFLVWIFIIIMFVKNVFYKSAES